MPADVIDAEIIKKGAAAIAAAVETMRTPSNIVATNLPKVEPGYLKGVAEATKLKEPRYSQKIAERLAQKVAFKKDQDAKFADATAAANAIESAAATIDKASETVTKTYKDLQSAIDKARNDIARAEQQKAAALKAKEEYGVLAEECEKIAGSDILKRASTAKLPKNDEIARLKGLAEAAAGRAEWGQAVTLAQQSIDEAKRLERAIRLATDAQKTYNDDSAESFKALKKVKDDLDRLKIKPEGRLATLDSLQATAKSQARSGQWLDAMNTLSDLDTAVADAEKLVKQFDKFASGTTPRLLLGTLDKISKLPSSTTNSAVLAKMQQIYTLQCTINRERWLTHLKIAGANVKDEGGTDSDHYTTFNNSVPTTVVSVNVEGATIDDICDALFEVANWSARIHATYVIGGDRYHKYWGGFYSNNVQINSPTDSLAVLNPTAFNKLEARYTKMETNMRARIKEAIDLHGRIPKGNLGPDVT
jgi:hypothetical protein